MTPELALQSRLTLMKIVSTGLQRGSGMPPVALEQGGVTACFWLKSGSKTALNFNRLAQFL
jgi:hypothetical protein